MSNVNLFNGCTITVEKTGKSFHTFEDWGLYITNTDCISEPKQKLTYINVPGSNKMIDASETLTGYPTYESRQIKIDLAGVRNKTAWDSVISAIRNDINGQICRITFDNDIFYFWRGRVDIKDFESALRLGTFTISVPNADPYKYNVQASNEPWMWDTFNFETGIIIKEHDIEVDGKTSTIVPSGYMPVVPTFVCSNVTRLSVTDGKVVKNLFNGSNRDPRILVNGDKDVRLTFEGYGSVVVVYRGGSL